MRVETLFFRYIRPCLIFFGAVFVLVGLLSFSTPSGKVYAAGGVGDGGGGGGCSGTSWCTGYGWGWAKYNTGGRGPSESEFRNGTTWSQAQSTCNKAGARKVYAHIILNAAGNARVYDFKESQDPKPYDTGTMYAGHFSPDVLVDHGRAESISTREAYAAFSKLPEYNVDISRYTFGDDVAWFCYDYAPVGWSLSMGTTVNKRTVRPGQTITWTHKVRNLGPNTATYSWNIQKNYSGNGWSQLAPVVNSDGNVSTAKSTYNPSGRSTSYAVPTNTPNGTVFCQRIAATNASGPGTTTGTSAGVCVTVSSSAPAREITCDSVTGSRGALGTVGGSYSYVTDNLGDTRLPGTPDASGMSVGDIGYTNRKWVDNMQPDVRAMYTVRDGVTSPHLYQKEIGAGLSSTINDERFAAPKARTISWDIVTKARAYRYGEKWEVVRVLDYVDSKNVSHYKKVWQKVKNADGSQVTVTWQTDDYIAYNTISGSVTCYSATCSIDDVSGSLSGGRVSTNDAYITVEATLINGDTHTTTVDNLPLPTSMNGGRLSLTSVLPGQVGSPHYEFGNPLEPGESVSVSFTIPNPYRSNPESSSLTLYPDFYYASAGDFYPAFGTPCGPVNFDVYAPFRVTSFGADAILSPTEENPDRFNYNTWVCVDRAASLDMRNQATGRADYNVTAVISPAEGCPRYIMSESRLISSYHAGDEYCVSINLAYKNGYVGPSGNVTDTNTPDRAYDCAEVHNEPYLHIFNSDTKTNGAINTYTKPSQPAATGRTKAIGSGAQFAARANGSINGFSSAILRANSPLPQPLAALGLSFSNTQNRTNNSANNEGLGGQLGASYSMSNFYSRATQGTTTTSEEVTMSNIPAGVRVYDITKDGPVKTLSIGNGTSNNIPNGQHSIIKVDGNVYIRNNITLSSSWGSLSDVPSLYIIAKGNIYIDPAVTRLDGVYVAQARDNDDTAGVINTCARQGGDSPTDKLNDCANQLVVYGSFASKKTYFNRGFGSLRNGANGERLKSQNRTCDQRSAGVTIGTGDCAAEIFIFTPEIYLSNPGFVPTGGATSGKYDYITSLSPVL